MSTPVGKACTPQPATLNVRFKLKRPGWGPGWGPGGQEGKGHSHLTSSRVRGSEGEQLALLTGPVSSGGCGDTEPGLEKFQGQMLERHLPAWLRSKKRPLHWELAVPLTDDKAVGSALPRPGAGLVVFYRVVSPKSLSCRGRCDLRSRGWRSAHQRQRLRGVRAFSVATGRRGFA